MARRRKDKGRPLAENSRVRSYRAPPQPKKRRGGAFMRNIWVTCLLGGLLYFTSTVIPAKDKEKIIAFVQERLIYGADGAPDPQPEGIPASAAAPVLSAAPPEAAPAELADARTESNSGGGLSSFLGGLFGGGDAASGEASGRASQIAIASFPRAYNNWSRTDYLNAEAAELAMQTMDRSLQSGPTELAPLEEVSQRVAAIYRDGGRSLLIYAEALKRAPAPVAPSPDLAVQVQESATSDVAPDVEPDVPVMVSALTDSAPSPAPAVQQLDAAASSVAAAGPTNTANSVPNAPPASNVTSATSEPLAPFPPDASAEELSGAETTDDPEGAVTGLPEIELAGIIFLDHSGGKRGVLDLRATRPSGRTLILRGRITTSAVSQFLEELKFAGMFQGG